MKLWAAACLAVCLIPNLAAASVERFAVIIGNNRGLADDPTLRYAESDAARVFEVLRDIGGFQPVNMVLLRDENAQTVQHTLIAVNDRIRSSITLPDTQAMLFVYYSGHADAEDLHMGRTRLPIQDLAQLARGSAANFRLVVLDACRSGALTRLKGGKILPAFDLPGERVPGDGVAFLTASAANEDAQESEELHASFFTHALVSGMLGAADRDANGDVSLDEAYLYAYQVTLRATSRTWSGTQHPAFRYDLRGQGSVVLTRPEAYAQQRAKLRLPTGTDVLLMRDGQDGAVVAELGAATAQRTLSLRPGRYFVRARGPEVMYEGQLDAVAGSVRELDLHQLQRIDYAQLVRKGGNARTQSQAVELGARLRSVMPNTATVCVGVFLGYAVDFASFGVRARLNACTSGFENAIVAATVNAYDLEVQLYRAWDLSALTLAAGLGGGLSLFSQRLDTRGRAPDRTTLAPFVSLGVAAQRDLGFGGLYGQLDLTGETHFLRLRASALAAADASARFGLRAGLGVGKHF
jgi:hypothetical protein